MTTFAAYTRRPKWKGRWRLLTSGTRRGPSDDAIETFLATTSNSEAALVELANGQTPPPRSDNDGEPPGRLIYQATADHARIVRTAREASRTRT